MGGPLAFICAFILPLSKETSAQSQKDRVCPGVTRWGTDMQVEKSACIKVGS